MGIWRWDVTTGVVEWDQTTERLHGIPPGSFNGTFEAFEECVHPSERDFVKRQIEEALRNGPDYTVEYRARYADTQYWWLRGRGQVIRENGKVTRLIGVVWKIANGENVSARLVLTNRPQMFQRPKYEHSFSIYIVARHKTPRAAIVRRDSVIA